MMILLFLLMCCHESCLPSPESWYQEKKQVLLLGAACHHICKDKGLRLAWACSRLHLNYHGIVYKPQTFSFVLKNLGTDQRPATSPWFSWSNRYSNCLGALDRISCACSESHCVGRFAVVDDFILTRTWARWASRVQGTGVARLACVVPYLGGAW